MSGHLSYWAQARFHRAILNSLVVLDNAQRGRYRDLGRAELRDNGRLSGAEEAPFDQIDRRRVGELSPNDNSRPARDTRNKADLSFISRDILSIDSLMI